MTGASPPLISVLTVVRNGAASIGACLESVASRACERIEHVVVDGASTDGTLDLLRKYEGPRLRWLSEPDGGVYEAMNKAVGLARGAWLLFLGADDLLLADARELGPRLEDARTIYYGDAFFPRLGRRYDGPFDAAKLARRNICHQAVLYPRAVFAKYRFDLRYRYQADWELNMRLFADRQFRFEYVPVVVARYNDVDGASTRFRDLALERDYPRLLWRHFSLRVAVPVAASAIAGRVARKLGWRRRGEE